jgi:hypothetical protein
LILKKGWEMGFRENSRWEMGFREIQARKVGSILT